MLLWLTAGDERLGARARRALDRALAEERLAVSAISFWEIAMLADRGRVELRQPLDAMRDELIASGLLEIEIDGAVAITAARLAGFHGDPADRFIVATATLAGASLMTADTRILDWPAVLRRVDARD